MAAYTTTLNTFGLGTLDTAPAGVGIPAQPRALSGAGSLSLSQQIYWLVARALSGSGTLTLTRARTGNGAGTLTFSGVSAGPKPKKALAGSGTLTFLTSVSSISGTGIFGIEGMNSWTANWWATLPAAYRAADRVQNLEYGGYPLAKYMFGVGAVAGTIRAVSDRLWDGTIMDVEKTADSDLPWLAQMIGISAANRNQAPEALRDYVRDVVAAGLPAVGTRQSIIDAAKRFLVGTKQTTVLPSATDEFTLILLVKVSDVPGGDLAAYAEGVRATGIIPAGYVIQAVASNATWDQFDAANGTSWNDFEALATTWNEVDSLGVTIT